MNARSQKMQYETWYRNQWYWTYLVGNSVRIVTAEAKDIVLVERLPSDKAAFEAFHQINLDLAAGALSLPHIITLRCRKPHGKDPCELAQIKSEHRIYDTQRLITYRR